MERKRKNKKILLRITMILIILMSFIGVNTLAKYISKVNGTGLAEVAKWSFKVNGETSTISQIKLIDTVDSKNIVKGKIAPGTNGAFDLNIDATGTEVDTNYQVKFQNETSKPQNLKFVYDGNTYTTLTELSNSLKGVIKNDEEDKQKNIHIDWKWDFESDSSDSNVVEQYNIADTNDAQSISNYSFDIVIIGTQGDN